MENAISLQVLFRQLPQLNPQMLTGMAKRAAAALAEAQYELPADTTRAGSGFVTLDGLKVSLDFHQSKLSDEQVEAITFHIHGTPELPDLIAEHKAYIELSAAEDGGGGDPVALYVTLTALASMLSTQDALVVANLNGCCGFNAAKMLCMFAGKDWIEVIQKWPLVFLFSGALVHEMAGDPNMAFLRTHGNGLLGGIPEIGCTVPAQQQAEIIPQALETFETLMGYMTAIGIPISTGHTMGGKTMMITVKETPSASGPDQDLYASDSGMLLLEFSPKPVGTAAE